jgi:sugar transferase EpsL
MNMYRRWGKRGLDLALSLPALFLLSPVFLALAVLVRLRNGSPILFRQLRPGRYGQPFTINKFRTMTDARDTSGQLLPDSERLTTLGRVLRSTSLDELPELVNVLHGEMSLVGPRPLEMRYLDRYTPEQARRHNVRPGITGYAQVNGRDTLEWDKRLALDVLYVDHCSLMLDLKIILMTVGRVITRDGVIPEGASVVPEFWGTVSPPSTEN